MPERDLVLYLLQKDYYQQFYSYIDLQHIKDNYRELHYLYLTIKALHEDHPDTDFDLHSLQAYFFLKYPDADSALYQELFKTLEETPLDPQVGVSILQAIKRRKTALDLSEEAMKFASGHGQLEKVLSLSDALGDDHAEELDNIEVVSDDLVFLVHEAVQKPGLRWRLDCLNKSLGSLRPGDFGFIFARPETGKTTFLASEVSHMATQLQEGAGPIIWFNNEEQGNKVMLRVYQAYFGVTLETLLANPAKYNQLFKEQVQGRFKLIDNANTDKYQVEKILKQLQPSLIIFDQADKIKGFAADREDLRLGAIYIWGRELAKQYGPTIAVCQADGNAENQKWLTMEHVANAKTSKQAEADWILGIGKIHADGAENIRYLNISKNKLMADSDSIPDLRHGRFETYIEAEIARYKDIMRFN